MINTLEILTLIISYVTLLSMLAIPLLIFRVSY